MKTFCALAVICSIAMVQIASGKKYFYRKDIRPHLKQKYLDGAGVDDLMNVAKCTYEGLYNSEETEGVDKIELKQTYDALVKAGEWYILCI